MKNEEEIWMVNKRVCIPFKANDLKKWSAVSAHVRAKKHRAFVAALRTTSKAYRRVDMKNNLKELTQSCIYGIKPHSGEQMPRSLSTAIHGMKPN